MYVRGGGGGVGGAVAMCVCVCVERKVYLKQRCVLLVYICPSVCLGRNRYKDMIKPACMWVFCFSYLYRN